VPVSLPTATTCQEHPPVQSSQVFNDLSGLRILDNRTWRYGNLYIGTIAPETSVTHAIAPILGTIGTYLFQMGERSKIVPDDKNDITTATTISAVGSALGNILLTTEGNTTIAPVSGGNVYISLI
jgi:hypothetical protein